MFNKILFSDSNSKYFGHVYLPGRSKNLDNSAYRLEEGTESTMVGVLMQISDYKIMDDGRLTLIVQALEKFRIIETKRHHSPYAIATVEILPDEEQFRTKSNHGDHNIDAANHQKAVESAFLFHPYEVRPTHFDDLIDDESQTSSFFVASVSPLSNFDGEHKLHGDVMKEMVLNDDNVFKLEQEVWVKIDEMLNLLQQLVDPSNSKAIPIPTQILGLLPLKPYKPWPDNFALEKYAQKVEKDNGMVGTFSKSPFVRVDKMKGYSPYRRAQRLSYMVPSLTENISSIGSEGENFRQKLLEMSTTEQRLDASLTQMRSICHFLYGVLKN